MVKIDVTSLYSTPLCSFKNFTQLTEEEKKLVWEWRNHESIRSWMYNKDIIEYDNHLQFISNLDNRKDAYYWLVFNEKEIPIGVFDITRVDYDKDFVEVGYYLSPKRLGDGLKLLKECLYLVFNVLKIQNVYFGVHERNKNGMLLDEFLGCKFNQEEFLNGERYLISTNLNNEIFNESYKLGLVDFVKYMKNK